MDAYDIPETIQWHEGMLLVPQHFQQSTWRFEALLHYHTTATAPFHWGIRHLRVDEILLAQGTFRVDEVEAIMPDGLVVVHGNQTADDLALDLTPYTEEMRQSPRPIHLVVPRQQLSATPGQADARYASVEGPPIADCNTGDSAICIPRLRPQLRLLYADTPPQRYVGFPLVHVRYQNDVFARTDFISPTYAVSRQSPLGQLCAAIATHVRDKAMFLAQRMHAPAVTAGTPLMLEDRSTLHSLVAALPPFEALIRSGVAHPYALYLVLCALMGHVAGVGMSLVPPLLAPYNHNDLRATFAPAQEFIAHALDEGVHEAYRPYPFQYADGLFSLSFDETWMHSRLVLGVRGQPGMSEQDVLGWVEGGVIGASSLIPSMRERRILGAARQRLEGVVDLVPARGVVLFALATDPAYMKPNEALQILNTTGTPRPAEIVLYVMHTPPEGGQPAAAMGAPQ